MRNSSEVEPNLRVNFMSAGRVEKRGMYIREPRPLQRFFSRKRSIRSVRLGGDKLVAVY